MGDISLILTRATSDIDRILNAFYLLISKIFIQQNADNWMKMLVDTILNNQYLLISVSLVICGFVIGLIKRVINL